MRSASVRLWRGPRARCSVDVESVGPPGQSVAPPEPESHLPDAPQGSPGLGLSGRQSSPGLAEALLALSLAPRAERSASATRRSGCRAPGARIKAPARAASRRLRRPTISLNRPSTHSDTGSTGQCLAPAPPLRRRRAEAARIALVYCRPAVHEPGAAHWHSLARPSTGLPPHCPPCRHPPPPDASPSFECPAHSGLERRPAHRRAVSAQTVPMNPRSRCQPSEATRVARAVLRVSVKQR